jgi:hypothetical protein
MSKREYERAIFEAFLRVAPDFAGEKIVEWKQPEDERDFPDVVCICASGRRVGVELGEWLHEDQIRAAKGRERIQKTILRAVGEQGDNQTRNIYAVYLFPKPKAHIKPADAASFRSQLFRYIEETDQRWPNERFWQSPQRYRASNEELAGHSVLQRYLNAVHFDPSERYEGRLPNGRRVKRHWPAGQDWIRFLPRGGSFSHDPMFQALVELLLEKKEHYGGSGTGFDHLCLIIYYNSAVIYNTPAETLDFKFPDAVQAAKQFIGDDQDPFDKILVFIAVNEGRVLKIL